VAGQHVVLDLGRPTGDGVTPGQESAGRGGLGKIAHPTRRHRLGRLAQRLGTQRVHDQFLPQLHQPAATHLEHGHLGANGLAGLGPVDEALCHRLQRQQPALQRGKTLAESRRVQHPRPARGAQGSLATALVLADAGQLEALELQQRLGHAPARVLLADALVHGHTHPIEENLAEHVPAVDATDGPHADAGAAHVHQQEADAGLRPCLGVGAHQAEHHVGVLRVGGPDLGAGDDVVVALAHRPRAQRGQVRARIGLRVALAPPLPAAGDGRQVGRLLRRRTVARQHRADHVEGDGVEFGCVVQAHHLVEGQQAARRPALAAPFGRPVGHQPAHAGQLGVPAQQLGVAGLAATAHRLAQVMRQALAHKLQHLGAEGIEVFACVVHAVPHGAICRCSTRLPMAARCTSEAPS
jgi:hypothetical protein